MEFGTAQCLKFKADSRDTSPYQHKSQPLPAPQTPKLCGRVKDRLIIE